MSYIFGGDTGLTYEQLKAQRERGELMQGLAQRRSPRTIGEGINSAAGSIMGALVAGRAAGELARKEKADKETLMGSVEGRIDPARMAILQSMPLEQQRAYILRTLDAQDAAARSGGGGGKPEADPALRQAFLDKLLGGSQPQSSAPGVVPLDMGRPVEIPATPEVMGDPVIGSKSVSEPIRVASAGNTFPIPEPQEVLAQEKPTLSFDMGTPVEPTPPVDTRAALQDQYFQALEAAITAPPEFRQTAEDAAKLLKARLDAMPSSSSITNYEFYAAQEREQGRQPLPFGEWSIMDEQAAAGDAPPELVGTKGQALVRNPQTGEWEMQILPNSELDRQRRLDAEGDQELVEKEERRQIQRARAGNTVIQDLQRGLDLLPELSALSRNEGVLGGISRTVSSKIPGTIATQINQFTESALSNVGLDTLQQMRENSPTGGALGQVPIQQQMRLEKVLGSLMIDQPVPVLEANMKRVMNIYTDIIYGSSQERARAVEEGKLSLGENNQIEGFYFELPFDERGRTENEPSGYTPPERGKILTFNPETGLLE